jgi:GNAT superfamily N-acetyltransferase
LPLFHTPGYLARITALVVAATARGIGVGRALLAATEAYAWSTGCVRIEVTSGDHRPDAHAFYERLGYHVDERRFIKRRTAGTSERPAG